MAITLNLTNDDIKAAQSNIPAPLEAGTYGAVVFDSALKESKAGNPMYVLDFKITEGKEGVGRKIRSWFVLKQDALFSLIALNKAVDFPYPTKDTPAGAFEFPDAEEYLGKQVNLQITLEPYNSVDDEGADIVAFRNNVKKVFKYDEDKIDGVESEDAKSNLFI